MNSEQARVYIEKLKTIKTGSTRAANKALKELAELLADEYAAGNNGEPVSRKKNFLLAAGFIQPDDMI